MKKIGIVLIASLMLSACTTQNKIDSPVNTENFTFVAEELNLNAQHYSVEQSDSYGNSWNRMPSFSEKLYYQRSGVKNLDEGYGIQISEGVMKVNLPYYAEMSKRRYMTESNQIVYTTADSGVIKFTSSDYTIQKSIDKRGKQILTVNIKNQSLTYNVWIEVYKKGQSFVSINSDKGKSISYNGYLK